jgi:acyl carrier protein
MSEVLEEVVGFIKGQLQVECGADDDCELDSLQVVQVVAFVEERFKVSMPVDALTTENFASPRLISDLVEGLRRKP